MIVWKVSTCGLVGHSDHVGDCAELLEVGPHICLLHVVLKIAKEISKMRIRIKAFRRLKDPDQGFL